ncbi:MAG: hypothetical protein Athens071425_166 [Parcubacteria group bacterium Athens0714_25]|nr:MAG: hypothetical protein Athens071425_166 [Parcubacteria group bacterium Athens0714_25]
MKNNFIKPLAEREAELGKDFEMLVLGRFLGVVKKKIDFDSWKKLQEMTEAGESPEKIEEFLKSRVANYQDMLQNVISDIEKEIKN